MKPLNNKMTYQAKDIELLTGLDPVRKRPGMYTNTNNPNHMAQEVIDNSVDEALAGYASQITVELYPDTSLKVTDDGRGMPVDIHPQHKISGIELILTKLHSGGKFSNKNYTYAGGLHGVGVSVVNALTSDFSAQIKRDKRVYKIDFSNGNIVKPLRVISDLSKNETGTQIIFKANPKYFDTVDFDIKALRKTLHAKAILCPNLQVKFINHCDNTTDKWCYETGLLKFFNSSLEQEFLLSPTQHYKTDAEQKQGEQKLEFEAIFAWHNGEMGKLEDSYVNLIPTLQGGTHVNAFKSGLLDGFSEFCKYQNLLPKNLKITQDDLSKHLNFVISLKMTNPLFVGQTKEKLANKESMNLIANFVKDKFLYFLNHNLQLGKLLAEVFIANANTRLRANKKQPRKKYFQGPSLPGKLSDCINSEVAQTELFLVEGDSAGGSAKQARDRNFQAIMPLRGKILNSWEIDSDKVTQSKEIEDISTAIGVCPNSSDLSNLRYGKIIILADADPDGAHISTLLCALFLKHYIHLVINRHVYVAKPPLFRIDIDKEVFYAQDEVEKQKILMEFPENKQEKAVTTRFKGLGEMNPSQLRQTTMALKSRTVLQLTLQEQTSSFSLVDKLLSKKRSSDRRVWLENKGNLAIYS